MTGPPRFSPVLVNDLYALTMLQAYFEEQIERHRDVQPVRPAPPDENFFWPAVSTTCLTFLETLRFDQPALASRVARSLFGSISSAVLESLRFTGDVFAVPEGTPVFANEPILEIEAPIDEAQLVETLVMDQVHVQTVLASKAARVVEAAQGRPVVDFGAAPDARHRRGSEAVRRTTSLAWMRRPTSLAVRRTTLVSPARWRTATYRPTTMNTTPFARSRSLYPDTTLLVDTLRHARGRPQGDRCSRASWGRISASARCVSIQAIWGTLPSRRAPCSTMPGCTGVQIFASGGLDEDEIARLVTAAAPIDGFGVGSDMAVSRDAPGLDIVYKLVEYAGRPRLKLSPGKAVLRAGSRSFAWKKAAWPRMMSWAWRDESPPGTSLAATCDG